MWRTQTWWTFCSRRRPSRSLRSARTASCSGSVRHGTTLCTACWTKSNKTPAFTSGDRTQRGGTCSVEVQILCECEWAYSWVYGTTPCTACRTRSNKTSAFTSGDWMHRECRFCESVNEPCIECMVRCHAPHAEQEAKRLQRSRMVTGHREGGTCSVDVQILWECKWAWYWVCGTTPCSTKTSKTPAFKSGDTMQGEVGWGGLVQ